MVVSGENLDKITYRPFIEENARSNALLSTQLNALHTNDGEMIDQLNSEGCMCGTMMDGIPDRPERRAPVLLAARDSGR